MIKLYNSEKTMRKQLMIPDENFFIILNNSECDIKLLDYLENDMGHIIIPEIFSENIKKSIKSNISTQLFRLWEINLKRYCENYYKIINEISIEKEVSYTNTCQSIFENTDLIYRITKQFSNSFSKNDAFLYGISYYLRNNTDYEPIIISDDSHHNLYGHFLSAYFGFNLIQLSLYEILKFYDFDATIINKYSRYKGIGDFVKYNITSTLKRNQYEPEMIKLFQSCLLPIHPKIKTKEDYDKLIK
jgi:hypothetical protein